MATKCTYSIIKSYENNFRFCTWLALKQLSIVFVSISSTGHMTQLTLVAADDILHMFAIFLELLKRNKRICGLYIFKEIFLHVVFL